MCQYHYNKGPFPIVAITIQSRQLGLLFLPLNDRGGGKRLLRLLALLVALASAAPVLQAQDWDHINGRDKVHDPTGAWILRFPKDFLQREFALIAFHKGGTLTGNIQGEKVLTQPLLTTNRRPTTL